MPDLHNAAVLLMSLPEDDAATVLAKLEPKLVEQVSIEIARTVRVTSEEQEQVIREFSEANPAGGAHGGGLELARTLVKKALGGSANNTLDNIRQTIEAIPFSFLRHVDSQNVLTFLVDEHPQTIALILSYLPANFGAEVLAGLPQERQIAVVQRMARMGQTNPEIIHEVERGLERRMSSVMTQSFQSAGGVDAVAAMLNVSDRITERTILENLAVENADLVDEIRRLMFVFEDISKFGDKDIQTILKNVDNQQWALALKGASPELKEKVLKNMSQRATDMLKEEMEFLGAVKRSAVEGQQQKIVDVVRGLQDSGEIEMAVGNEQEQLLQ
jgi:flagellar motor switch protein FliG